MDSIRKVNPNEINDAEYWLIKKMLPITQKFTRKEILSKFVKDVEYNFPKTLFIYMPLFAMILWLFHNKKRWYYFDHGIFTLHYFSFLLLIVLLIFLFNKLIFFIGDYSLLNLIRIFVNTVGYIWMIYYFFPAHHRFYGESRIISFLKSCLISFINSILFLILLVLFFIYTFINLH